MDADMLLDCGLSAAQEWEKAEPGSPRERAAAEQATGALVALNARASRGLLPARWRDAVAYAEAT